MQSPTLRALPDPPRTPRRPVDPGRTARSSRSRQAVFGIAALLLTLLVLYLIRHVIGAFILGGLIAFVISPWVDALERRQVRRPVGTIVLFVVLAAAVLALAGLFVPLVTSEIAQLQQQGPGLAAAAQQQVNDLHGKPITFYGLRIDLTHAVEQLNQHANEFVLGQATLALGLGLAALGTLMQGILMLIVAFLISLDAHRISRLAKSVVPDEYRADFDSLWTQLKQMLRSYLKGQLLVSALIGLTSGLVVWLLGLDFPVALGVLAGLTALVPYLGPFIGGVPAILLALAISPEKALAVAVAYFVISNVILNFVYPKIVGDAVKLPPLLVIVAFIAGFSLAGILGMFVAVPIAAGMRILFDFFYPRFYTPGIETADATA